MLGRFRRLMPREDRFFDLFERHSRTLVAGADALNALLAGGDAIDQMHKTVKTIKLYEVRSFEPLMREMGGTVVEAAKLAAEAVPLLAAIGTHAARINTLTDAITRVGSRSDDMEERGLTALFAAYGRTDPIAYIIGAAIYGHLEDVVDRSEDVAYEISGIVVENV